MCQQTIHKQIYYGPYIYRNNPVNGNTIPGFRPDQPRVIGVHLTGGQRSPVGRQCPISFAGIWMAARSISIYTLLAIFNITFLYYYSPLHLRNTIRFSVALLQCVVSKPAPSWLHAYLPTSAFLNLLNIELWFEPYNQSILKHDFSVKAVPLGLRGIPITFSHSLTLFTILKIPISSKAKPLRTGHFADQIPALHSVEAYVHPHLTTVNQGLDSWLEST